MLQKQNRLKSRRAFSATYNNNCSVADSSIILCAGYKKTDKDCPARVGFVVSKKIHKRAVIRNRIKRRMRECIRLLIKNNNFNNEFQSYIFIAKANILDKNFIQIQNIITNLLFKLANKNI